MKKILSLLLVLLLLLSFAGCASNPYKPVKSTREEKQVVYTFKYGTKTYKAKYELYRYFFLNYKNGIDGGDASVWSGADKDGYIERMDALILDRMAEIYSVYALCKKAGIRLNSNKYDDRVAELVAVTVEGGYVGDEYVEGIGSYDAFLLALKASNSNYAVADLLFRYSLGVSALSAYYHGVGDGFANLSPSDADLTALLTGEGLARTEYLYFDRDIYTAEQVEALRLAILNLTYADSIDADKERAIQNYILGNTVLAEGDVMPGQLFTANSVDRLSYGDVADTALSLEAFEVSEVKLLTTDAFDGYYFLVRLPIPDGYLSEYRDAVVSTYADDVMGRALSDAKTEILASAEKTNKYGNISHADIEMP